MRGLSDSFLRDLQEGGVLSPIREAISNDRDLILEIRDNALDIYAKGNCLLRLEERGNFYSVGLHEKFRRGTGIEDLRYLINETDARRFLAAVPSIKQNIAEHGSGGSEIEYEQMLIRANNHEPRLNSEYYIIDRQVVTRDGNGRFDLLGMFWPRVNRRRGQTVPLALMEVKFGLNPDIAEIHEQLGRYYESVANDMEVLAQDAQRLLGQKLELGMFSGTEERLAALKTLKIDTRLEAVRFVLVLVDYNPSSKLLDMDKLKALPFYRQVDIFNVGFGLWQKSVANR